MYDLMLLTQKNYFWQVGIPLFLGSLLFSTYAKETRSHEPDNVFQTTVYRPVAPLYEHAEETDERIR